MYPSLTDAIALAKQRSDCATSNVDAMVQLVKDLDNVNGCIIECGSYKCGMTIAMAAASKHLGRFSRMVYAFDVFGGLPYGEMQGGFQNFATNDFEEIKRTVEPYTNIELIRGRHEDTVPAFTPARQVALLFMDSDFHSSHVVCLSRFWDMIQPGGAIVFHDWSFDGVQQAVNSTIGRYRTPEMHWGFWAKAPNMGLITK